MKDKKLVGIIGLVLVAALVGWTVMTLMGLPAVPDAAALGGEESQAYLDAKAAYDTARGNAEAYLTMGVLGVIAFFFVFEPIPLAIAAMFIPCYFALSGILTYKEAFSSLMDSSITLFAGMFVVGGAMFQTGLAQKVGLTCVKMAGGNQTKLVIALMLVTGILSAFLSNTGTVAVLLPVCLGIADSNGWNRAKLLMPVAIMASAGGMITMAGTPPNMTSASTLAMAGIEFGFFDFAWFGIPASILSILYMLLIGNRLLPDRKVDVVVEDEEEGKVYDPKKQVIVGTILVGVVIFMALDIVPLSAVAVFGGLLCVVTGCCTEKEAYESIDWGTIFLFIGAISLANAMSTTGAGPMMAMKVVGLLGESPDPLMLMIVLFGIAGTLTQFMSNTAAAALLCPVGLNIAQALGADPTAVVLSIGFACCSAYVTPVATPPNTMVYGPGGFVFMDYVKCGGPLFILTFALAMVLLPIIWPMFPAA